MAGYLKELDILSESDIAYIVYGLSKCLRKNPDFTLRLEQFEIDLRLGELKVLAKNHDVTQGFIAFEPVYDHHIKREYMHIWGAFSQQPFDAVQADKDVMKYCRDNHLAYVSFGAQRMGWFKKLEGLGWQPTIETVFKKVVTDEQSEED